MCELFWAPYVKTFFTALARETNRYAKLTGIIKEIGFDLPSVYTGDSRNAETVSTSKCCLIFFLLLNSLLILIVF